MKNNWQTKTLGEVLEIERGGSPRPIKSFLTTASNGINWVKIGDTQGIEKYIYKTEEKIKPEGAKRSRIVNEGDFILSNSMSFGRPYIMRTTGCIHDGWLVLRDKAKHLDQDFLYYLLSSDEVFRQFNRLAAGATVRNLNINLVRGVSISFPESLPEQRRIVAKLDDIFARIATAKANAEKNLANAREVFELRVESIFSVPEKSWKSVLLKDIISEIVTGPFGSTLHKSEYVASGVPVINPQNIQDGILVPLSKTMVSSKTQDRLSKYQLKEKDIVLARRGEMGRCGIVTKEQQGWLCGTGSLILRFNKEADERFLALFLRSFSTKALLLKASVGTTMDNLNQGILFQLNVPLPAINRQREIIANLDTLSAETKKLEAHYTAELSSLEELKKSVLRQAFSGEL